VASLKPFINPSGTEVFRVQWRTKKGHKWASRQETFPTRAQALRFKKQVESYGGDRAREILRGSVVHDTPTFREWTERYLDAASGLLTGVEPGTRDEYHRVAENYLYPVLGDYPIDAIDQATVGKWVAWQEAQPHHRTGKPVAAKTVKNRHGILSAILGAAMKNGLRPDNPARGASLSRGVPNEPVFLSLEEFRRVTDALPDKWKPLAAFLIGSQLRWSEAAALEWSDINTDTIPPTVRVSKAWKRNPHGPEVIGPPKSRKSRRTVALWPELVAQLGTPGTGYVFHNPDGGRIPARTFYKAWVVAVRKSGISQRPRIHDLRHTGASWLIADGVPLAFIRARLGHESIQTTVNVYGHLLPDAHTRMADSLQKVMRQVSADTDSASTPYGFTIET
jgi:integrase